MSIDDGKDVSKRNKRNAAQKLADRALIAELTAKEMSIREIAAHIGIIRPYTLHPSLIGKELKKMKEEWLAKAHEQVSAVFAQNLAVISLQMKRNWEAYDKSTQDRTQKKAEVLTGAPAEGGAAGSIERQKQSVVQEAQCGDVGYQHMILDLVKEKNKMFNVYGPTKVQLSGPDEGPMQVSVDELDSLSEEELRKIAEGHDGNIATTESSGAESHGSGGGQAGATPTY